MSETEPTPVIEEAQKSVVIQEPEAGDGGSGSPPGSRPTTPGSKKKRRSVRPYSTNPADEISPEGTLARQEQREKARRYAGYEDELTDSMVEEIRGWADEGDGTDPDWLAELRIALRQMEITLGLQAVRRGEGCTGVLPTGGPAETGGWIRMKAEQATRNPLFDQFIMLCIIINCVFMAAADPTTDEVSPVEDVMNTIFLMVFTFEVIFKSLAQGKEYVRDSWNYLDMVVVLEGWISFLGDGGSALAGLKTFRILRPLRVANRLPSVKMIITAIINSLPAIIDTFLVYFFFLFIFSMLCGTLWAGTFDFRCMDDATGEWVDEEELCYPAPTEGKGALCDGLNFLDMPYACDKGASCQNYGSSPEDGGINFDNILYSFLTLFAACTMEGWGGTLMFAQNVMGDVLVFLIFVAIIVLGNFTIINIMIASILVQLDGVGELQDEMDIEKDMLEGRRLELLEARNAEHEAMRARGETPPPPPLGERVSKRLDELSQAAVAGLFKFLYCVCYQGVCSKSYQAGTLPETHWAVALRNFTTADESPFSNFIQACILFNMLVLALDGHGVEGGMKDFLSGANLVLTIIFIFEMVLKHVAIGIIDYWTNPWNIFDGVIVLGSVVELYMKLAGGDGGGSSLGALRIVRMLRLTRVARLARLLNKWPSLKQVCTKIYHSVMKMGPIALLLVLFMFIFAIMGMQFFGPTATPDEPYMVFDTFYASFVMCFYVLMGEGWVDIMYFWMAESHPVACLYFMALIVIGMFVLVNLILAVVLDGSMPGTEGSKKKEGVKKLLAAWDKHDLRMAFDKMQWFTARARNQAMRTTTLVAWHHAGKKYGGDRFMKLAQLLGLKGEQLKTLNSFLMIPYFGDDYKDRAVAKTERAARDLLLPYEVRIEKKKNAPASPRMQAGGASKEDIEAAAEAGKKKKKETKLPEDPFDEWDWLRLHQVSTDVADFANQFIPEGFEAMREKAIIKFVSLGTGEEQYAKAAEMARAEELETMFNEPVKAPKSSAPATALSKSIATAAKSKGGKDAELDPGPQTDAYGHIIVESRAERNWREFQKKCKARLATLEWQRLIMVTIIISCVLMLFSDEGTPYASAEFAIDVLCTLVFILELFLKWGAARVVVTKKLGSEAVPTGEIKQGFKGYVDDPWNCLDFAIILSSILMPVFNETEMTGGYAVCAVVRACRPLRVINQVDELKVQVYLLLSATNALGSLSTFMAFSMAAYAIVGMQLLKGLMFSCDDGDYAEDDDYLSTVGGFPDGAPFDGQVNGQGLYKSRPCGGVYRDLDGVEREAMGEVVNEQYNFDDFGQSLLCVYTLMIGGWFDIVLFGLSAQEEGYSWVPYGNGNVLVIFYFFFGIAFFMCYIFNEFVGVIFDSYVEQKEAEEAAMNRKEEEKEMMEIKERVDREKPMIRQARPTEPWRIKVCKITETETFENIILMTIAFNAVTLAIAYAGQSEAMTTSLDVCNCIFSLVFVIEMGMKLVGMGFRAYIDELMNQFDCLVTCVSFLDSLLFVMNSCPDSNSTFLRLVRSMRVFRLLHLIALIEGCEVIMLTCTYAYPQIVIVCELLTILLFFFSNIGVVFFQHIDWGDYGSRYTHFQDEWAGMELLFILMTGDAWNDTMGGMLDAWPDYYWLIVSYFLIFILVLTFVIMNLFVMVVCEAFEVLNDDTKKDMERVVGSYRRAWSQIDPDASGVIPDDKLERLVRSIPAPFGAPFPHFGSDQSEVRKFYKTLALKCAYVRLNLPDITKVTFNDTLFLLIMLYRIQNNELRSEAHVQGVQQLQASVLIHSRLKVILAKTRIRMKKKEVEDLAARVSASGAPKGGAFGSGFKRVVIEEDEPKKATAPATPVKAAAAAPPPGSPAPTVPGGVVTGSGREMVVL